MLWLGLIVQAANGPAAEAMPPWVRDVVGSYSGVVRNAGRMECHRTVFALRNGALVGHYWIDDPDPFEGELMNFVPDPVDAEGGTFTWIDKFGVGKEHVVFDGDGSAFHGTWGNAEPDSHNLVWGVRGGTAACEHATS